MGGHPKDTKFVAVAFVSAPLLQSHRTTSLWSALAPICRQISRNFSGKYSREMRLLWKNLKFHFLAQIITILTKIWKTGKKFAIFIRNYRTGLQRAWIRETGLSYLKGRLKKDNPSFYPIKWKFSSLRASWYRICQGYLEEITDATAFYLGHPLENWRKCGIFRARSSQWQNNESFSECLGFLFNSQKCKTFAFAHAQ